MAKKVESFGVDGWWYGIHGIGIGGFFLSFLLTFFLSLFDPSVDEIRVFPVVVIYILSGGFVVVNVPRRYAT